MSYNHILICVFSFILKQVLSFSIDRIGCETVLNDRLYLMPIQSISDTGINYINNTNNGTLTIDIQNYRWGNIVFTATIHLQCMIQGASITCDEVAFILQESCYYLLKSFEYNHRDNYGIKSKCLKSPRNKINTRTVFNMNNYNMVNWKTVIGIDFSDKCLENMVINEIRTRQNIIII